MGRRILKTAAAVCMAAALLWGIRLVLQKDHVFWNGTLLPRHDQSISVAGKRMRRLEPFLEFTDLRQLDARDTGMTVQQFEWFRQNLPDCAVLWDVPIQGMFLSRDTAELYVDTLTDTEIHSLQYLPELTLVDVGSWDDYPKIQALQQRYPRCTVRCRIEIAGEQWDGDVVSLVLENADPEELLEKLGLFTHLESVLLTGSIPGQEQLQQLQEAYPEIFFLWKMEALGTTLETDQEVLDLSGIVLSGVEELEQLLPWFPGLKTVNLDITGLSREALTALAVRYPRIQFVFDLPFGEYTLRTDAEEIDISNTPLESAQEVEAILPCFRHLKKVVMCECGLSGEEMAELNDRYPDIRFVWSVELAGKLFRTDAVHFTPNRWGLSCDNENIADLRYCTDMVCVDIGHQIKVTDCSWVKNMPKLKYLILAETGISDLSPLENHGSLIYLELFLSKVKDYSILTTCKALEDLNLCYTQGDPTPIGEMTWLKRLWWSGCWLARKQLADKLPDTYTEYLSLSSTGRGWREGQHYYDMRDFIGMEYMVG